MPFQHVPRSRQTFKRTPDWGDVYWFDFGYPVSGQKSFAGVHPALVVTDSKLILRGTTQIIPLSGIENKRQGYGFHVEISKEECPFLDKDSIAKVDQIYCVLTNNLPDQYYVGVMLPVTMRRIYAQLLRALGADKLISSTE